MELRDDPPQVEHCPRCRERYRYPEVLTHQPRPIWHWRGGGRRPCKLGGFLHPVSHERVIKVIPDETDPMDWVAAATIQVRAMARHAGLL